MKINRYAGLAVAVVMAAGTGNAGAEIVARFDMSVRNGSIREEISGKEYAVEGHFAPENVKGAVGEALRFDGYTSHVKAAIGDILPEGSKKATISLWVALPCYPIIRIDTDTKEKTAIVTCLDEENNSGFGFYLGFDGKYSFRTYVDGWPVNVDVDTPLPVYQWNNLTAVVDTEARTVKLYNNGAEVGSSRANGSLSLKSSLLYMGQSETSRKSGPFELMSFNGLIDDITIWNEALDAAVISGWKAETPADLNIPSSRFADETLRPAFHGMPAAGWTNECHGMVFSDGRYHLFFQKNADGPYMARLHWGHISSENLYDWREEKIALAPGNPYDIKGCWSGCVFTDDMITGGKPNILYTAVDYAKASIAGAAPVSDGLDNWIKYSGNPIIGGRPAGLSDDFRDPYFFRSGENAYIIVGTSKNGIGATTLHKYNPVSKSWSNAGDIFFAGSSQGTDGTFWEMPNITEMENGKWLFTATPLNTSTGVKTLYWTGAIGSDGKFLPDADSAYPRMVEMNSRQGFGLLSPTIYRHDGKTLVLGIVPDKLSGQDNWNLGWAHCYSLPREWSLASDGSLIQKPYEGLRGLRSASAFERTDFSLAENIDMAPVNGRAVEILAECEVGASAFGFNIFKSAGSEGVVRYNPGLGELVVDFSNLRRLVNDNGVYDGIYRCQLPQRPASGSTLKLNIFIDHSILDIFVNDCWATSIRVFPTDSDATGIEAFGEGSDVKFKSLKAWNLDVNGQTGYAGSISDDESENATVNVYSIDGSIVRTNVSVTDSLEGLSSGLYIVGNKKVCVK